ncbi:MAG: MBL fold metallo-hydrolase [Deltaproteobacteria bacterium]|nr:MBL fold metallo-hydrolase [Deltaproteobacteria bacterium]
MIFSKTGEVRDGLFVIGAAHFPLYLLKSEKPLLVEGGISVLGEVYRRDLVDRLGNLQPEMILLTHAHFDHCGAVSYLKKAFPGMKIAASPESAEILKRPNAVNLMRTLSESARESVKGMDRALLLKDAFEPFEPDVILRDGDRIEIMSGLSVQVLQTPGHTRDFLSYYIPEKKILFASEAGGCAVGSGNISVECLTGFDVYLASLRRLAAMEAEILCQGHFFVYTDQDVQAFFARSIRSTLEFKEMVEKSWDQESGDMQRVMAGIKELEYDPLPQPKQPEQAYLANLEARVKSIVTSIVNPAASLE